MSTTVVGLVMGLGLIVVAAAGQLRRLAEQVRAGATAGLRAPGTWPGETASGTGVGRSGFGGVAPRWFVAAVASLDLDVVGVDAGRRGPAAW